MKRASTIEDIKEKEFSVIAVHWKHKDETPVFVKVRDLSDLQIQAIGNFSLLGEQNQAPMKDTRDIQKLAEIHSNIVKAALVSPTYQEICELADLGDFSKTVETKCKEIEKEIIDMPRGAMRSNYEKQLASARFLYATILPNVFMSEIAEWVLGVNRTNIKLATDDIILNAALMQANAKTGRISDYIEDKTLSAFNKRDIDIRGMYLFNEWSKKNRGGK